MTPRVFISRPAALSSDQTNACQHWLGYVAALGFESFDLPRPKYEQVPWAQLRHAITQADGALILGFRQLRVDRGWLRPDTPETAPASKWWATPWNQVEAALAITAHLPVLVVPEPGIAEGVFARDVWGGEVYGVDLYTVVHMADMAGDMDASNIPDHPLYAIAGWARSVRNRGAARANSPPRPRPP